MPEPDEDLGAQELGEGTTAPNVVRGAPFAPGRHQSDGPQRPRRHVPTAEPSAHEGGGATDPTCTEPEDGNGSP